MKLFTVNPYKPHIFKKIIGDYLLEANNHIDGLQQYIDRSNPN